MLTKRGIYDVFSDDLAKPLELEDFQLSRHHREGDATRSQHLAYHFHLSTRDMARLGYLMLQGGNWHGRQLIPADWVTKISTTVTPSVQMHPERAAKGHLGYGYLWWTLEEPEASALEGAYAARGAYGQYLLVVPKRRMVIAHKVAVDDSTNYETLREVSWREFILAAKMLVTAPCP
jgi:CubicO group peptidase (beta-lactamase class C family)